MSALKDKVHKLKKNDLLTFIGMIVLALFVAKIPLLNLPFSWTETFFHEISHGLAALITFGKIVSIELNFDGSGLCTTRGGFNILISFSGYAGACLWGALMYVIVDHNVSHKIVDRIASLILTLIALSCVFWCRDIATLLIMAVIALPFIIILKTKELLIERFYMQFTGIFILLSAIKSPLALFDGEKIGDGANLAKMTFIPEFIWVFTWMALGIGILALLLFRHIQMDRDKVIFRKK